MTLGMASLMLLAARLCCCLGLATALHAELAATSGGGVGNTTAIAKVSQMLAEMRARSQGLLQTGDEEAREVQESCASDQAAKEAEVSQLALDAESLEAQIGQLTVDVQRLAKEIQQHDSDINNASVRLQESRRLRAEQREAYSRDAGEFGAAIGAIDAALFTLSKHSQESQGGAGAFLGQSIRKHQPHVLATPLPPRLSLTAHSVRQLRRRLASTPLSEASASGGLALDGHLFDEFDGLSTAGAAYEVQTGSVEELLAGLKTTFASERSKLVDSEHAQRINFETEEASLEALIKGSREAATSKRGLLATSKSTFLDVSQNAQDTRRNANSTQAFLTRLTAACEARHTASQQTRSMRLAEIEALGRAIDAISGMSSAPPSTAAALLRFRSAVRLAGERPRPTAADAKRRVAGFLRLKAAVLRSAAVGRLAAGVASAASEDPLAKVKAMIADLVVELQASAAKEATQKAWCDTELKKNKAAQVDATADIEKSDAERLQYAGDLGELELQLGQLNETLSSADSMRSGLVANRSRESDENQKTIEDSDASVQALDTAIFVLEDFFSNASKAAPAPTPPTAAGASKAAGNETLPEAVARAPAAAAPLSAEGRNVLAMLEVVRSDYTRLAKETRASEAEAVTAHKQVLTDHDVMVATAEADQRNKLQELARLRSELAAARDDLNASQAQLADAQAAHEELKPPCLNAETYEERQARRDAEVSALRDATSMLDELAAGGAALGLAQQRAMLGSNLSATLLASSSSSGFSSAEPGGAADDGQLTNVAGFLTEIRDEVSKDMAEDRAVHASMQGWCDETVRLKQAAIEDASQKEMDLRTEIESSAREREVLLAQIAQLEKDLAKNEASLEQSSSLRGQENEAFSGREKELLQSISSLQGALTVLSRRFGNDTAGRGASDFASERQRLEAEKSEIFSDSGASEGLVAVALRVKKALVAIPGGEAGLFSTLSAADGAAFRAFLSAAAADTPAATVPRRAKRALALSAGGRGAERSAADGHVVFGILRQLLTTFKADLAAAQAKESEDSDSFEQLTSTKLQQVQAAEASISSKKEQLAQYTATNAAAKEDLVFNQGAKRADLEYLANVQQQCRDSSREFETRNSTRAQELSALAQAISILAADEAAAASQPAAADAQLAPTMLAARRMPPQKPPAERRVFRRSAGVAFARNHSAGSANGSSAPARPTRASEAARWATTGPPARAPLAVPPRLAALSTRVALGLARLRGRLRLQVKSGSKEAFQQVVDSIDTLATSLQEQKALETKMHSTCVREANAAGLQLERQLSDEARLNNSVLRLGVQVNGTKEEIARIREDIEALNASINASASKRAAETQEFDKSLKRQEAHQAKLTEAIQTLRAFYNAALVQRKLAQPAAENASERERNRVNRSSYEARTNPGNFSKPLAKHDAAIGIIGILQMLLDESKSLHGDLLRAEQGSQDAQSQDLAATRRGLEQRDRELLSLQRALGDSTMELQRAQADRDQCRAEMAEVREYQGIVQAKCGFIVDNYGASQEARSKELENLQHARDALKGMIEDTPPAAAPLALVEAAQQYFVRAAGGLAAATPSLE